MGKVKALLLFLLGGIIALFFYENWGLPLPIKLFGKELVTLPGSLIIMVTFLTGFIFGWLAHVGWRRQRSRKAQATENLREQSLPSHGETENTSQ